MINFKNQGMTEPFEITLEISCQIILSVTMFWCKDEQKMAIRHFIKNLENKARVTKVELGFALQFSASNSFPSFLGKPFAKWNKHLLTGTLGIPVTSEGVGSASFYITLADGQRSLDEMGWVIGQVLQKDSLASMSKLLLDSSSCPLQPIYVSKVLISNSPFESLSEFVYKEPETPSRDNKDVGLELKLKLLGDKSLNSDSSFTIFVARLSPHTTKHSLVTLFSRFGKIVSCDVKRDSFAFIQFETIKQCEEAVKRMDGVVVDDRRIRVDYAHSGHQKRKVQRCNITGAK